MHTAVIDRLIHLGESITMRGVTAANVELLLLAHDARDLGIEAVLVDVMIDEDAPVVVRERAFALVAARMAALPAHGAGRAIIERALSFPVGAGR
jgi:hypothetical protein